MEIKVFTAFIERSRDGRYKPSKEKWAAIMREYRAYKQKLYKEGKIWQN